MPAPRKIYRGNNFIGRSRNWPATAGLLDAALNELKIFDKALSAADFKAQVNSLYKKQGELLILIFFRFKFEFA